MKISLPKSNKTTFIILLALLILLCFYYVANFQYHQHTSVNKVISNYTVGETLTDSGTVTETFDGGFYIPINLHGKIIQLKVYTTENVSPGDTYQLVGVLGPDYQINTSKIIVVEKWSNLSVMIRSFLAFLVLIFVFNRYWKFNIQERIFMRRK